MCQDSCLHLPVVPVVDEAVEPVLVSKNKGYYEHMLPFYKRHDTDTKYFLER